jgi:hypothetical protein
MRFSALYFFEKTKTSGSARNQVAGGLLIYPSISDNMHGSATPNFVIPSEAEGPAVRLDAKQRPYQ